MRNSDFWKKLIVMSMFVMIASFFVGCTNEEAIVQEYGQEQTDSEGIETRKEFLSDSREFRIMASDLWIIEEDLHEDSILSLYNEEYQSYLITLKDGKEVFPEGSSIQYYSELAGDSTLKGIDRSSISEYKPVQIEGLSGNRFSVSGVVEEVEVTYEFLVLEDETDFYQVILWSFSENIENNPLYYDEIISSFKVLKEGEG